jgi:hypothetical protein
MLYIFMTLQLSMNIFMVPHKILNYKIARAADVPDEDVGVEVTRARTTNCNYTRISANVIHPPPISVHHKNPLDSQPNRKNTNLHWGLRFCASGGIFSSVLISPEKLKS